ncbi:MAG: hypothetical protein QNJ48_01500 [Desulfobacterales bacterium]|nr:hypothetical protein [Desulfobacterales bacterium]MDJ0874551.1 hypothetical protein [Desulfobacterales bacterium]MDJ0882801.1 hypothetical protein [Desulfobacterales bacterium]
MKSKELAKIRSVMEDYRHYKLKFVQFGQHCEQLVQNAKLSELKVGEIKAREMAWSVMDLPITVRFGLVMTKEGQLLGKIDFEKSVPAAGEADRSIYTLYFDKMGNMLEGLADSFSTRRIIDEHDVPYILYGFLQRFLKDRQLKEKG